MPAIIEILQEEHRNIEKLLIILEQELNVFMRGERPDYDILHSVITYFLDYPDQCHHPKEDIIFSKLIERDPNMVPAVKEIGGEHRDEASRVRRFALVITSIETEHEVPRRVFEDAVRDFTNYQRAHIAKEERLLFPACLAKLQPDDWRELDGRTGDRTDPLINSAKENEFSSLRQRIMEWAAENAAARI